MYVCLPKTFLPVQIFWPWRRTGWQWGGFYGEQYLSASDTSNTATKTRETKTKKDRNHRDKGKNNIFRLWHFEHRKQNLKDKMRTTKKQNYLSTSDTSQLISDRQGQDKSWLFNDKYVWSYPLQHIPSLPLDYIWPTHMSSFISNSPSVSLCISSSAGGCHCDKIQMLEGGQFGKSWANLLDLSESL